jgi:hypothetical protein
MRGARSALRRRCRRKAASQSQDKGRPEAAMTERHKQRRRVLHLRHARRAQRAAPALPKEGTETVVAGVTSD